MPESMTAEKAAAILTQNIKGAKVKPSNLLEVARACRILSTKWGWDKLASFLTVSTTQLRQIDKINELAPEVRKLVGQGKLRIDTSYQLSRLDRERQVEAARLAQMMKAHEVRRLVQLLLGDDELTVLGARDLTLKDMRREVNMLVLPLTSQTYADLQRLAKQSKVNIHDYVLRILEKHIGHEK